MLKTGYASKIGALYWNSLIIIHFFLFRFSWYLASLRVCVAWWCGVLFSWCRRKRVVTNWYKNTISRAWGDGFVGFTDRNRNCCVGGVAVIYVGIVAVHENKYHMVLNESVTGRVRKKARLTGFIFEPMTVCMYASSDIIFIWCWTHVWGG